MIYRKYQHETLDIKTFGIVDYEYEVKITKLQMAVLMGRIKIAKEREPIYNKLAVFGIADSKYEVRI